MNCDEIENQILDYHELQLPDRDREVVERHLAGCAGCQALARRLLRLDVALQLKLTAPEISGDFNQRLARRIQAGTVVLPEAQRAARKRQLQADYEAGLDALAGRWVTPGKLLHGCRYALPAALAGWLAWLFMPRLVALLDGPDLSSLSQSLLLAVVSATVFICVGLAAAFPRQLRRLWSAS